MSFFLQDEMFFLQSLKATLESEGQKAKERISRYAKLFAEGEEESFRNRKKF